MNKHSLIVCLCVVNPLIAQSPMTLRETSTHDRMCSVQTNVEISGALSVTEKGKTNSIAVSGRSLIAYDERVLSPLPDITSRSLRLYRQVEFRRAINDRVSQATIRPMVRRMVVLRSGTREVPFSPDGPLTFAELDLVRTDLFTPALAGLLPAQAVVVGDTWPVALSAVEELTDFERVEHGNLECRFVGVDGRVARLAFSGTVEGVNEDGPVRQKLEGQLTFDLDDNLIAGLTLTGVKSLLDGKGKTTGRIEGKLSLTRKLIKPINELSDDRIRSLKLEPDGQNTLLLHECAESQARFTHSRRWRVSAEQGRQITLDGPGGAGVLITIEPLDKVPPATEYAREARDFVVKQNGKVSNAVAIRKHRPYPRELDRFGMDIEIKGSAARMEYAVIRQPGGGATLAARLPAESAKVLLPEIEHIASELNIGPAAPAGVVPLSGK